jgi:hypothetical protein
MRSMQVYVSESDTLSTAHAHAIVFEHGGGECKIVAEYNWRVNPDAIPEPYDDSESDHMGIIIHAFGAALNQWHADFCNCPGGIAVVDNMYGKKHVHPIMPEHPF